MSLGYVAANLRVNGWFYVADARFPAVYHAAARWPVLRDGGQEGRLTDGLLLPAVLRDRALVFYAGSYDYGADVRYSLATYPPLAMLGGLGLARLAGLVDRSCVRTVRGACLAGARDAIPSGTSPIRSTEDGAWAARADVRFAQSLVPRTAAGTRMS